MPFTCLWALKSLTVPQALIGAVVVTGEGQPLWMPLSICGKGILSLLIYLEQRTRHVLLQEAVTKEGREQMRVQPHIFRLQPESLSHAARATLLSSFCPVLHAALACCVGAEPSQYKVLSSPLFFSSSIPLSKMSTKESLLPPLIPLPCPPPASRRPSV